MKTTTILGYAVAAFLLIAPGYLGATDDSSESFKKYGQEFKGKIAKSYEQSQEWWPSTPKANGARPPRR